MLKSCRLCGYLKSTCLLKQVLLFSSRSDERSIFDIQKISFRSPNKLLFCEILNESSLSAARFFNNQYIALKLSVDGILFAYHWPSKTVFSVFCYYFFAFPDEIFFFFWGGKLSVGSSKPNGIRTTAHLNFGPYFQFQIAFFSSQKYRSISCPFFA